MDGYYRMEIARCDVRGDRECIKGRERERERARIMRRAVPPSWLLEKGEDGDHWSTTMRALPRSLLKL